MNLLKNWQAFAGLSGGMEKTGSAVDIYNPAARKE
jgi:hypothetical protein